MLQLADRLRIAVIGLTFDSFSSSQK